MIRSIDSQSIFQELNKLLREGDRSPSTSALPTRRAKKGRPNCCAVWRGKSGNDDDDDRRKEFTFSTIIAAPLLSFASLFPSSLKRWLQPRRRRRRRHASHFRDVMISRRRRRTRRRRRSEIQGRGRSKARSALARSLPSSSPFCSRRRAPPVPVTPRVTTTNSDYEI